MKKEALVLLSCSAIMIGCSSYKPLKEGVFHVGYEETKLPDGGYLLTYYGSDHDDKDDVENYWHRRARDLCSGAEYDDSNGQEGAWKSGGYVILPPVFVATENANPTYSGEVRCKAE
jgi:hypothetical protein